MKTIHKLMFVLTLLNAVVLTAGARISNFQVTRDGNVAVVQWTTDQEQNVDHYILQRSTDQINWTSICEKQSKTGFSTSKQVYEYKDNNLFKGESSTFSYRIFTVDKDGTSTLHGVVVSTHGSSGIKHTWGSIKAMFR